MITTSVLEIREQTRCIRFRMKPARTRGPIPLFARQRQGALPARPRVVYAIIDAATVPYITQQPTNTTNILGGQAVFSVIANGTGPLSYQWYFTNADGNSGSMQGDQWDYSYWVLYAEIVPESYYD